MEPWIILGIVALLICVWMLHWYLTQNKGIMTARATVVSKTPELALGVKWGSGWNYKILFESGSLQLVLYVLQQDYERLTEGMTGFLTWQNGNMLDFIPDEQEV